MSSSLHPARGRSGDNGGKSLISFLMAKEQSIYQQQQQQQRSSSTLSANMMHTPNNNTDDQHHRVATHPLFPSGHHPHHHPHLQGRAQANIGNDHGIYDDCSGMASNEHLFRDKSNNAHRTADNDGREGERRIPVANNRNNKWSEVFGSIDDGREGRDGSERSVSLHDHEGNFLITSSQLSAVSIPQPPQPTPIPSTRKGALALASAGVGLVQSRSPTPLTTTRRGGMPTPTSDATLLGAASSSASPSSSASVPLAAPTPSAYEVYLAKLNAKMKRRNANANEGSRRAFGSGGGGVNVSGSQRQGNQFGGDTARPPTSYGGSFPIDDHADDDDDYNLTNLNSAATRSTRGPHHASHRIIGKGGGRDLDDDASSSSGESDGGQQHHRHDDPHRSFAVSAYAIGNNNNQNNNNTIYRMTNPILDKLRGLQDRLQAQEEEAAQEAAREDFMAARRVEELMQCCDTMREMLAVEVWHREEGNARLTARIESLLMGGGNGNDDALAFPSPSSSSQQQRQLVVAPPSSSSSSFSPSSPFASLGRALDASLAKIEASLGAIDTRLGIVLGAARDLRSVSDAAVAEFCSEGGGAIAQRRRDALADLYDAIGAETEKRLHLEAKFAVDVKAEFHHARVGLEEGERSRDQTLCAIAKEIEGLALSCFAGMASAHNDSNNNSDSGGDGGNITADGGNNGLMLRLLNARSEKEAARRRHQHRDVGGGENEGADGGNDNDDLLTSLALFDTETLPSIESVQTVSHCKSICRRLGQLLKDLSVERDGNHAALGAAVEEAVVRCHQRRRGAAM